MGGSLIIAVWSTLHHSVHVCMILQLHDKDPKCKGDQCKFFDRFKIGGGRIFPLAIIVDYFIVARREPLWLAEITIETLTLRTFRVAKQKLMVPFHAASEDLKFL